MKMLRGFGIFTFGGLGYGLIEIAWRGSTHISMFFAGGLCFLIISAVEGCELFGGSLLMQAPFCALCITAVELVSGLVVNGALGLGVWDYSELPFNLWGQICLPFSALWVCLSLPALAASGLLRRVMFAEEAPRPRLLPRVKESAGERV